MWKKDDEIYNGNSIVFDGMRIFNPTPEMLEKAGYVREEPKVIPPNEASVISDYENEVQMFLDSTAKTRGYDNTYTCLSYLSSTDETWRTEATAFNAWRDQVWLKCHEVLNAVVAGTIQKPTVEELLAQMPELDWGVEARTTTAG